MQLTLYQYVISMDGPDNASNYPPPCRGIHLYGKINGLKATIGILYGFYFSMDFGGPNRPSRPALTGWGGTGPPYSTAFFFSPLSATVFPLTDFFLSGRRIPPTVDFFGPAARLGAGTRFATGSAGDFDESTPPEPFSGPFGL